MRQGKIRNLGEKLEISPKNRKKSGKIAEIWYNRLSVEISYRSPPITEILEILFLDENQCIHFLSTWYQSHKRI